MKFNFTFKIFSIIALCALTFTYALYQKNQIYTQQGENASLSDKLLIKTIPSLEVLDLKSSEKINIAQFKQPVFVHIWGSWCAPCETEMPDFLKYAGSLKEKGVLFILIAVQDTEKDVQKFFSKFKDVPENVRVVLDVNSKAMESFGAFKVPETFLFNKDGKHVNKFVGPQDWLQESYQTRLEYWLNN